MPGPPLLRRGGRGGSPPSLLLLLAGGGAALSAVTSLRRAGAPRGGGTTFVQAVPGRGLVVDVRPLGPSPWRSQLVSAAAPPALAEGLGAPASRPSLPLFAAACCAAAALLRSAVQLRAKGKPQTTSGVRVRKPKNNALRNSSIATFEELTTRDRYKPLCFVYRRRFARPKHKPIMMATKTGRESGHQYRDSSCHARKYRIIDFGRTKRGMFGEISTIEYDPYRNARICLVTYEDGEKRYILYALGFFVGQQVISDPDAPVFVGNAMPLDKVPIGTMIHNLEVYPNRGGQVVRSAGASAIVLSKDRRYVTVKLPSSEVRLFSKDCWCTIGKVGRVEHQLIKLGKAGKRRQLGFRPHTRGSAKNACDHPHGGGEGRSPIGHKHQKTKFGNCAIGLRTRKRPMRNRSTKFILIRRKKKSGRPD